MNKKAIPKRKIWRMNLVAVYYKKANPDNYRNTIVSIVYNLARIHRLEIAISYDHQFSGVFDSDNPQTNEPFVEDLFYLRSTDKSYVDRKRFEKLIVEIFHGCFFYHPYDVFSLYQKYNRKLPFPSKFERPLVFPFVEFHDEGQIQQCIETIALDSILTKEQDELRN